MEIHWRRVQNELGNNNAMLLLKVDHLSHTTTDHYEPALDSEQEGLSQINLKLFFTSTLTLLTSKMWRWDWGEASMMIQNFSPTFLQALLLCLNRAQNIERNEGQNVINVSLLPFLKRFLCTHMDVCAGMKKKKNSKLFIIKSIICLSEQYPF